MEEYFFYLSIKDKETEKCSHHGGSKSWGTIECFHAYASLTVGVVKSDFLVISVKEHEFRCFAASIQDPICDTDFTSVPGCKFVVKIIEVISAEHVVLAVCVHIANFSPISSLCSVCHCPNTREWGSSSGSISISLSCLFWTAEVLDPLGLIVVFPSCSSLASWFPSASPSWIVFLFQFVSPHVF